LQALEFWKTVTMDGADLLEGLIGLLTEHKVRYCVIGGQAVNAYAEPVVSLDLDLVVATDELPRVEELLRPRFSVKRFPHSLNVSRPGSDLRVQFQVDPRYESFLAGASPRNVLGIVLPVAGLADVLRGKVWAALDPGRRPSKRQKDLADIARILEGYPDLRSQVPAEVLDRLVS
jgi:hypothetical protein